MRGRAIAGCIVKALLNPKRVAQLQRAQAVLNLPAGLPQASKTEVASGYTLGRRRRRLKAGGSKKDRRPSTRFLNMKRAKDMFLIPQKSPAFMTTLLATRPSLRLGPREPL